MAKIETSYHYELDGFYYGESIAVNGVLGRNDTFIKPALKDGYWYQFNGNGWDEIKIPTTCAEAISQNLTCISNGPQKHNQEIKAVLENLVANESEKYRTKVSDDFVMSIEEIPEKTFEEVKKEKQDELNSKAQSIKNYENSEVYVISSLGFKADADGVSQTIVKGMIADGKPVDFYDYDNVVHEGITVEQLETLLSEFEQNTTALSKQTIDYQIAIDNCTTIEELKALEFVYIMMDFTK